MWQMRIGFKIWLRKQKYQKERSKWIFQSAMASSLDLYRPLRKYVIFTYSEREAQLIEDDLETLK